MGARTSHCSWELGAQGFLRYNGLRVMVRSMFCMKGFRNQGREHKVVCNGSC